MTHVHISCHMKRQRRERNINFGSSASRRIPFPCPCRRYPTKSVCRRVVTVVLDGDIWKCAYNLTMIGPGSRKLILDAKWFSLTLAWIFRIDPVTSSCCLFSCFSTLSSSLLSLSLSHFASVSESGCSCDVENMLIEWLGLAASSGTTLHYSIRDGWNTDGGYSSWSFSCSQSVAIKVSTMTSDNTCAQTSDVRIWTIDYRMMSFLILCSEQLLCSITFSNMSRAALTLMVPSFLAFEWILLLLDVCYSIGLHWAMIPVLRHQAL